MPAQIGIFRLFTTITVIQGTPVTALQYVASANNTAEMVSFSITQSSVNLSVMEEFTILRKTAGATVTAATTGAAANATCVSLSKPNDPFRGVLGTTSTGINATSEGTNGNELYRIGFSDLAGAQYAFLPEERPLAPNSGILACRIEAKMAATWLVQAVFAEYG